MPAAGPCVEVPLRSWAEVSRFFARDLEGTGLFIPMSTLLPAGSSLLLALRAPDGTRLALATIVERHRDPEEGKRGGVHVRFSRWSDEHRNVIAQWLAQAQGAAAGTDRREAPHAPEPDSASVAEVTAQLQALLSRLRSQPALSALGLPENAGPDALDERYKALVRTHHPHHFVRFGSPAIKRLATEVFVLIQKHYRAARKAAARPAGVAGLGPEQPRLRSSAAQRAISQSLQLLSLHQYDQARDVLEAVLRDDPDNQRLLAALHVVEGRRAHAEERFDDASAAFERVLSYQPDHEEARRALEALEAKRSRRQGGLLKRLLGGGSR